PSVLPDIYEPYKPVCDTELWHYEEQLTSILVAQAGGWAA
ncbi:MAG: hypothetical protein RLZZ192_90, partial [Pseudomonadota bacterium]